MAGRFAVRTLAYVVPTFALGYVWHLVLFTGYYRDLGIYRDNVIIPFGLASMLLQGLIFAFTYPRLVDRPDTFSGGVRFVSGAALLSWTFTTLAVAAKHPMTSVPRYVAIETAFTIVQFLLVVPFLVLASRPAGARPAAAVRAPV